MLDLPMGTVTLLFTDIEGSTQLLQRLGDDHYAVLLTECQRLMRAVFRKWNGYEVDTQGDAFFVVFAHALAALAAAMEMQLLLAAHSWPEGVVLRVRMGMHTGEPHVVSAGYIGLDVHKAARIMSAGHGGQVLLSQATCNLVAQKLPSQVSLRDLGEHHLKDLPFPERLFQLAIPSLPGDFPPLRTVDTYPHNLLSSVGSGTTSPPQGTQSSVERHQTDPVYVIKWSPDRHQVASAGHNRIVQVWGSSGGTLSYHYRGHAGAVIALVWSPDGRRIASASLDKTIQVWSAVPDASNDAGRKITSYDGHSSLIYALAWSPDGMAIVSSSGGGSDTSLHVWNALTGDDLLTYKAHASWVRSVAWSPGGRFIASGSSKDVQVWSPTTGQKLSTYHGHQGWVRAISWSPDGKRIASASEDKTIQIWATGTVHATVTYCGHTAWVNAVEWAPDGKHIASLDKENVVHIWDTATGKTISTFHLDRNAVYAMAWLPDGKHIALASDARVVKTVRAS